MLHTHCWDLLLQALSPLGGWAAPSTTGNGNFVRAVTSYCQGAAIHRITGDTVINKNTAS